VIIKLVVPDGIASFFLGIKMVLKKKMEMFFNLFGKTGGLQAMLLTSFNSNQF